MSKQNERENHKISTHTAALLLLIASADESIENSESYIINDIITDFFKLNKEMTELVIQDAKQIIQKSTDIYHIANYLNSVFDREDKVDLLYCIFEVAFADKEFHYMERHMINQIMNIMNIDKTEIIKAKRDLNDLLL